MTPPFSIEKCLCGHPSCKDYWLVGVGKFVQGSGFTQLEAEHIVELLNKERGANPMSRVVQVELSLNVEVECHFDKAAECWRLDEIVSMKVVDQRRGEFDLATSSILSTYLLDHRENELAQMFAQQEP